MPKMYQFIEGEMTEVVRWGNEILPITDHRTTQLVGQLVLFNTVEETYETTNYWQL